MTMLPYKDEMIERGIVTERELYALHCENDSEKLWHRLSVVTSRAVHAFILSEACLLGRGQGSRIQFGGRL